VCVLVCVCVCVCVCLCVCAIAVAAIVLAIVIVTHAAVVVAFVHVAIVATATVAFLYSIAHDAAAFSFAPTVGDDHVPIYANYAANVRDSVRRNTIFFELIPYNPVHTTTFFTRGCRWQFNGHSAITLTTSRDIPCVYPSADFQRKPQTDEQHTTFVAHRHPHRDFRCPNPA